MHEIRCGIIRCVFQICEIRYNFNHKPMYDHYTRAKIPVHETCYAAVSIIYEIC